MVGKRRGCLGLRPSRSRCARVGSNSSRCGRPREACCGSLRPRYHTSWDCWGWNGVPSLSPLRETVHSARCLGGRLRVWIWERKLAKSMCHQKVSVLRGVMSKTRFLWCSSRSASISKANERLSPEEFAAFSVPGPADEKNTRWSSPDAKASTAKKAVKLRVPVQTTETGRLPSDHVGRCRNRCGSHSTLGCSSSPTLFGCARRNAEGSGLQEACHLSYSAADIG